MLDPAQIAVDRPSMRTTWVVEMGHGIEAEDKINCPYWNKRQRLGLFSIALMLYVVPSVCDAASFQFVTTIENPDIAGFATLFGSDLNVSDNQLIVGSPNTMDPGLDEAAY